MRVVALVNPLRRILGSSKRRRKGFRTFASLPELVEARRALSRKLPVSTHRIAGVTFEGRQENLNLLSRLQNPITVMMEKEPENQYDPNAVAVKLLDDTKLGYIPRDETAGFLYSITFGRIRSIGQAANTDTLGCIVETQHKMPPVVPLSIPSDLVSQCAGLVPSLSGPQWDKYRADLCRRMRNRCSVSNVETTNIEARWALSEKDHLVKLTALAVQHPFLARLQYIDPDEFVDLDEIASAISALNPGISIDEATMVFSRQVETAEMRACEGWRVDTSLLDDLLVDDGRG